MHYTADDNDMRAIDPATCKLDTPNNVLRPSDIQFIQAMYKDECSQGPNTSEESGTYQSKNYPRNYPNNLNINKTISVANGKKIKITFLDFQLEDRWFNEIYDFITITDGN